MSQGRHQEEVSLVSPAARRFQHQVKAIETMNIWTGYQSCDSCCGCYPGVNIFLIDSVLLH